MQFFTSPEDLMGWVKSQKSPDEASQKIIDITGRKEEQDIVDTCKTIFEKEDKIAADVLYEVLARHNLTQRREGKMNDKFVKEAQLARTDSLYGNMDLRICPKLPFSQGKKLISTYNCRQWCLDSLVFDDDPGRVYCAEALWRRHVMDKFAREFKDKEGKWVGGYINERFQVFHDDGGNQLELAHGERTRKPRPHQYSTERRLEEGRGEKTYDLTASSNKIVKLASVDKTEDDVHNIFDDIIEMKQAGMSDEDIIYKVAEHYGKNIMSVAVIHKSAMKLIQRHNGMVYAYDNSKVKKMAEVVKIAQIGFPEKSTLVSKKDIQIVTVEDGKQRILRMETPVVMISNKNGDAVLQIVDGPDAGKQFRLGNKLDLNDAFAVLEEMGEDRLQDVADEVGLNENETSAHTEDYPIEVTP